MKSNRTGAICNPWAVTRFMMGFLKTGGVCGLFSGQKQQKSAVAGGGERPF
jgi:hypothetical protein